MSKSNGQALTLATLKEGIAAEAKQTLEQTAPDVGQLHDELLTKMLGQVVKVNFRQLADIDPDNEEAKLKKQHYVILVVEQVLALAKRNQWGLCRREGQIYLYNGSYWKVLDKEDLRAFLGAAAQKMGVDKFQADYVRFSAELLEQFEYKAYLPAPKVSADVVRMNLQNGTLEIGNNQTQLRAPVAADFVTHQLPFAYVPTATAPLFQAFLQTVQPDTDCQKLLAEYLGYVFVSPARLKLEKTLLLYGSGANGKSVFFEVVTALFGPGNVSHYSLQSLTTPPAYCRARLATSLVNYASEINGKLESDTFKQLVSGEPVEARLPYGEPFILTHYAKLIFNCNELPTDVEHTHAYFRRFLIVPFTVTIPEAQQDRQLAAKIIAGELSGVLNWVLDGLRRLLQQGAFTDCEAVRQQLAAYRQQSDSVRLFLDENEYVASETYTPLQDLYRDYKSYCVEDGYRPVNNRNFQKRLNANSIVTNRQKFGYVAYVRRSDTPH
jgi:putative DNA primase/helicase